VTPLFTVVTPCSPKRYETTLNRAISSVLSQTLGDWEHLLIVNHGEALSFMAAGSGRERWIEAPPNPGWKDVGAWNFRFGAEQAHGDYVAWLGDDDEYHPDHLETHLEALESGADFSLTQTAFYLQGKYQMTVGDDSYQLAHLDSNGVACRRELLQVGNWRDTGKWDADWDLVDQWRRAGKRGVFIPLVTGNHHDGWMARNAGLPD